MPATCANICVLTVKMAPMLELLLNCRDMVLDGRLSVEDVAGPVYDFGNALFQSLSAADQKGLVAMKVTAW